jgi:hypothetical protein
MESKFLGIDPWNIESIGKLKKRGDLQRRMKPTAKIVKSVLNRRRRDIKVWSINRPLLI